MAKHDMGIVGLGVMGRNLALNMDSHGFSVAGYDLSPDRRKESEAAFTGKKMSVAGSVKEFIKGLKHPRKILLMVPAGLPVDAVISAIKPLLKEGDLLIDGGNSFFQDTADRIKKLEGTGILYVGTGVSGGEEGARKGPSIMPGGNPKAWPLIQPVFQAIAAKVEDGSPCCRWVGGGGAGHFVKMVHNGIEYGDMQMICEAYTLMDRLLGLTPGEMHDIFSRWNEGALNSYLIEITARIMDRKDERTGRPIIDVILDTAGQKGTGKWTSQAALDLGVPAQTIAEAVFARTVSALKEERLAASELLGGPEAKKVDSKKAFIEKIGKALYASKICSYAQGFQLMRAANQKYQWDLNPGDIAFLWRAGCIIRAQFLGKITEAFERQPDLPNLLLEPYFQSVIEESQEAWRTVVALAVESGIPTPAFSSALHYYDSYRTERLPANLLQAQRDYFGAHTYERVDEPRGEFFHTDW